MSDGFFIEVTLSKSDGVPNFGVFVKDVEGKRKMGDPELMALAATTMEDAAKLIRQKLPKR
jgi:hypothetical protein